MRWTIGVAFGLLSASACGSHAPRANVPSEIVELETAQFHSQFVNLSAGCCRKPAPVVELEARCEDPAICTATVEPAGARSWPELRVFGSAPGATRVITAYIDPFANKRVERTFEVAFVGAPPRGPIDVGHALPIDPVAMHAGARCTRITAGGPPLTDERRSDVSKWDCARPVAVAPQQERFRACRGMCPGVDGESYTICVQEQGARVAGVAVIEDVRMRGYTAYAIGRVDGALAAGACEIEPSLRAP